MVLLSDYRGGSAYGARHLIRSGKRTVPHQCGPGGDDAGPFGFAGNSPPLHPYTYALDERRRRICSSCEDAIRQYRPFHSAGELKPADDGRVDSQRNPLRILGLRRQSRRHPAHHGQKALRKRQSRRMPSRIGPLFNRRPNCGRRLPGSQAIRPLPLPRSGPGRTDDTSPNYGFVPRSLHSEGFSVWKIRGYHATSAPTAYAPEWYCHHPCKARFGLAGARRALPHLS
jgi:hypothetical protein